MSDLMLFPTLDSSHWAAMFAAHRRQAAIEGSVMLAQIRAAVRRDEELSRRGLCETSGLGDTGPATPAPAGVAMAGRSKQDLGNNREPSVMKRPTTALSAGAKVETVTPVMPGNLSSLPLHGGTNPGAQVTSAASAR